MTDTIQYLRNPTLPLDKALQADVRELIGMTDSAAQALEDAMQIHTIGDLAMSTYFDFAYHVVNSIEDPNHKFVKIGLPQDRLTNSWRKKGAAEVANANLDAIEGLGKKRFELLVEALGVTTVREMAYWPPYLHARQILEDTQSGSLLSLGRKTSLQR